MKKTVILLMIAVLAVPGIAFSQTPTKQTTLPQGTAVRMSITRTVSSANAQVGSNVGFETLDDVKLGGLVLAPKGSKVIATVKEAVPKRRMTQGGKLCINIDYLRLPNGDKLPLQGVENLSGDGRSIAAAMVHGTEEQIAGGIVASAISGKDIEIPKGYAVTLYTSTNYDLAGGIFIVLSSEAHTTGSQATLVTHHIAEVTDAEGVHSYLVECRDGGTGLIGLLAPVCDPLTAGQRVWAFVNGGDVVAQIGGKTRSYSILKSGYHPAAEAKPDQHAAGTGGILPETGRYPLGTGFAVTAGGHILTNSHVVESCTSVTAKVGNVDLPASKVSIDAQNDLALLKVSAPFNTVLPLRNGPRIQLGELAFALGYPLQGLISASLNMTSGNISALSGLADDARMLQFTAPVQPGNSGSPLLDSSGNVLGIVTSKFSMATVEAQNVNFAVKVSVIREFLESRGVEPRSGDLQKPVPLTDLPKMAGSAIVPLECSASEGQKVANAIEVAPNKGAFPMVWKSTLGTARFEVRLDGDFIHAEMILSGEAKDAGLFKKIEARKDGKPYVGRAHFLACADSCKPDEDEIEFTLVTHARIEGVAITCPQGTRFDCMKCQCPQPKRPVKFAWTPD